MQGSRLSTTFFASRTTLQLARDLLGCILVHETKDGTIAGRICETEAYTEHDAASHSAGGKVTERNMSMFLPAGHLYTYQSYGMHVCCNIVTERAGRGCAVLLRSVVPTEGVDQMVQRRRRETSLTDGPGKLCQAFGITLDHNGLDLTDLCSPLYVVCGEHADSVVRTPRIGIRHAMEKRWRFLYK